MGRDLEWIMKVRGNDLTWGVTAPGFSTGAFHIAVGVKASFAFSGLLDRHLKVYIRGMGLAAPGIWDPPQALPSLGASSFCV